jgi:hypothetical protein
MDEQLYPISEVELALSNMVGVERAQEIINRALADELLPTRKEYVRDELHRILQHIKNQGGLIAVVASAMSARLCVS